jgi:hypothetical protein
MEVGTCLLLHVAGLTAVHINYVNQPDSQRREIFRSNQSKEMLYAPYDRIWCHFLTDFVSHVTHLCQVAGRAFLAPICVPHHTPVSSVGCTPIVQFKGASHIISASFGALL